MGVIFTHRSRRRPLDEVFWKKNGLLQFEHTSLVFRTRMAYGESIEESMFSLPHPFNTPPQWREYGFSYVLLKFLLYLLYVIIWTVIPLLMHSPTNVMLHDWQVALFLRPSSRPSSRNASPTLGPLSYIPNSTATMYAIPDAEYLLRPVSLSFDWVVLCFVAVLLAYEVPSSMPGVNLM